MEWYLVRTLKWQLALFRKVISCPGLPWSRLSTTCYSSPRSTSTFPTTHPPLHLHIPLRPSHSLQGAIQDRLNLCSALLLSIPFVPWSLSTCCHSHLHTHFPGKRHIIPSNSFAVDNRFRYLMDFTDRCQRVPGVCRSIITGSIL